MSFLPRYSLYLENSPPPKPHTLMGETLGRWLDLRSMVLISEEFIAKCDLGDRAGWKRWVGVGISFPPSLISLSASGWNARYSFYSVLPFCPASLPWTEKLSGAAWLWTQISTHCEPIKSFLIEVMGIRCCVSMKRT